MLNAVINFYKPPGMSSAQAVSFVKHLTKQKTGHAGTLDPEAAGVLPILSGQATRLCDYMMAGDKTYLAEIAFGTATSTQDAQGIIVKTGSMYPDMQSLKAVLPRFLGKQTQMPPQYSALKIGGETAYKLARAGKAADLKPRQIRINSINAIREMPDHGFLLRVTCGKGTYIRTLASDLGEALGCPAHLRFLLREQSSRFHIGHAVTPNDFELWMNHPLETKPEWLLGIPEALEDLPRFDVPPDLQKAAINGVPLPKKEIVRQSVLAKDTEVCLFCDGALLGIFRVEEEMLWVEVMFHGISME